MTRWFATLRGQLATVVVVVLVVALTVTGVTAWTVLSRSLVSEVDTRLEQVAEPLAQVASRSLLGDLPLSRVETESLPSDYYVVFVSADASVRRQWSSTASGEPRSAPAIRSLTLNEVLRQRGEPFSVSSLDGASRWRVIALPLASGTGSVAVALPMDTLDSASAQLKTVLIAVGTSTALLGGALGGLAVHRSLRPVREIERTAAVIAAGELGSRVPVTDPHTEVGHLATSLNAMLSQLEVAFAAQEASEDRMRRFVSDASHELRTPLAAVRGYAELYRMGAVTSDDDVAATMRRVEESAARMGLLVEDLLQLARLDEGTVTAHERVDLLALARDAAQDLRAIDPTREVAVVGLDGSAPGDAVVLGDARALRQVVTNLVGNVAAHTPPGSPCEIAVGTLTAHDDDAPGAPRDLVRGEGADASGPHGVLEVRDRDSGRGEGADASGPRVVLEVRDRGPGIPADHAERVFERFYRADESRARGTGGGSGLGLAIVASIATAHRGSVRAEPREGGGTTMRVALPAAPRARSGHAEPGPHLPEDPPIRSRRNASTAPGGTSTAMPAGSAQPTDSSIEFSAQESPDPRPEPGSWPRPE